VKTKKLICLLAGCLFVSGTVFFIWIFSSTKVSAASFAIDTFIVGEKVEVTIGGMKEDRFYEACVIKEIVPNGYLVACGTAEYYVRPDWVRRPKAQPARPLKQDPGDIAPVPPGDKPPAQPAKTDFKAGDIIEASISGLKNDENYETCVIIDVLEAKYRVVCSGVEYVILAPWARTRSNTKLPLDRNNLREPKSTAPCDTTAPGPPVKNSDRFSATLAKRKIFDNAEMTITGGITAPLKTGIEFVTFILGNSYVNTVTNGQRINDAAPPYATVYTAKSKHILCQEHADITKKTEVETAYNCFKFRGLEWVCAETGAFKYTPLNY